MTPADGAEDVYLTRNSRSIRKSRPDVLSIAPALDAARDPLASEFRPVVMMEASAVPTSSLMVLMTLRERLRDVVRRDRAIGRHRGGIGDRVSVAIRHVREQLLRTRRFSRENVVAQV